MVQHYFMIGQIAGVVSLLIHYIIDVVKKRKKVAVEQVKVEPKYLNTVSINIAEN